MWDSLEHYRIKKFPGQTEPTLSAEVELISTITEKKSWTRPPIQMEFQVLGCLSLSFYTGFTRLYTRYKGVYLEMCFLCNIHI